MGLTPRKREPNPASILIERANVVRSSRNRPSGLKLRFKIQHLMWLSVWIALLMAAREPFLASIPEAVFGAVWVSGVLAVAIFVSLYVIAFMVEEGGFKDQLVLFLLYVLAGDLVLFLMVFLLENRA